MQFEGNLPFYVASETPSSIRRGEILGIRLLFINNLQEETMGLIVLEPSDEYCFVETGADGEVEHYKPTLVCGGRHHMVMVYSFFPVFIILAFIYFTFFLFVVFFPIQLIGESLGHH